MAVDLFNRHFDFPVLLAIREAFESGTWDGWMRAVTALGDHGAVWIALGVALLLFRRTRLTGAAILLALTLVALVGNMGLKPLFDRLRPCDIMGFTLLPACPPDPSFPSGHTAASFASAAVLWAPLGLLPARPRAGGPHRLLPPLSLRALPYGRHGRHPARALLRLVRREGP